MDAVHPLKSLAPRDIVARAIDHEMARTGEECMYIDIAPIGMEEFRHRFPGLAQKCADYKINLAADLRIPVVPAAHYTCGGVYTNLEGRTSILNLNAVGETACTGLHGANRLASTSLLECLTTGYCTALADAQDLRSRPGQPAVELRAWKSGVEKVDDVLIQQDIELVRSTMWNYVGLVRSPRRLTRASRILSQLKLEVDQFYGKAEVTEGLLQLRNALQTSLLVVYAAQMNPVSKGCHYIQAD
jgi:L-aspartate oxidase